MGADRVQDLIDAAVRQPGARERATGIIKFQCPACREDGHDAHQDNAGLFMHEGTWGCAFAKDTPDGRRHWQAIAEALGAVHASTNGHGRTHAATMWDAAVSAPDFLNSEETELDFLEARLLAAGSITEWFAPRGLGKTLVEHALLVKHALNGKRVLLIDRDNSRREVKRRLRAWGADGARTLKVLTRENAPALTDRGAWAIFPFTEYDLIAIDSIDASTEGVGEGDSAKPSKALASILDIAHRAGGPAILVLGNTIKSAAHSRGSGVVEDRADIVFEVRDATDLRPTGTKDWWHELPPAGVDAWAQRASRRKRREVYRLAFIASKFRIGEEPDPFCFEVDLRTEPWTLRDATDELVAAGKAALDGAQRARAATLMAATEKFITYIETAEKPVTTEEGEAFLIEQGLKRKVARELISEGDGRLWKREQSPGKGGPKVFRRCPGGASLS
jgi:hypothetical protein